MQFVVMSAAPPVYGPAVTLRRRLDSQRLHIPACLPHFKECRAMTPSLSVLAGKEKRPTTNDSGKKMISAVITYDFFFL